MSAYLPGEVRRIALRVMRSAMRPRLLHVVPAGEPNEGARSYEQPGLEAALDALTSDKTLLDALALALCNCHFTRGQGWRKHEHECFGVRAAKQVLNALGSLSPNETEPSPTAAQRTAGEDR